MERDPQLTKMIKESGVQRAPEGFTGRVMDQIGKIPGQVRYRPLIGKAGRVLILLFVVGIIALSVAYSEPGGQILSSAGSIRDMEWPWADWSVDLQFLSEINISTWLLATVVALFILVLSDAGLSRKRFT